jgi:hypothetical protein
MPGARCARSLVCEMKGAHKHSHHGHTGNTRHSPRNGFNGFLRALPGDRAFLPPSSLRSLLLKNLISASGYQDHTTSPSAGFARSSGAIPASTASRPTSVTIAKRPFVGTGWRGSIAVSTKRQSEEFFARELDTTGKSVPQSRRVGKGALNSGIAKQPDGQITQTSSVQAGQHPAPRQRHLGRPKPE